MPASSGFSDDGSPVRSAPDPAGRAGLRRRARAADRRPRRGPDADRRRRGERGFVATVLGLRGWPVAAEDAGGRARPRGPRRRRARTCPGARLHLTHLSTAGALDLVRAARRRAGLPVTCDVTPHHLALTDEWVAGARAGLGRREAERATRGRTGRSSPRRSPPSLRVNPPLRVRRTTPRPASPRCSTARPTPSPPTTRRTREVDKAVEFGAGGQRDQRHRDGARRPARCGRCRPPAARAGDRGADDRAGDRRSAGGSRRRTGRPRRGRAGRPGRLRSLRSRWTVTPERSPRRARTRRCSAWSCPAGSCSRSPAAGSPTRPRTPTLVPDASAPWSPRGRVAGHAPRVPSARYAPRCHDRL